MIEIDVEILDDFFYENKGILTRGFIIFKNNEEEWEILNNPMYVFSNWLNSIEKLLIFNEEIEMDFYLGSFILKAKVEENNIYLTDKHFDTKNNIYSTFLWKDNKINFVKKFIQTADKLSRFFYKNGLKNESIDFNKKINHLKKILQK